MAAIKQISWIVATRTAVRSTLGCADLIDLAIDMLIYTACHVVWAGTGSAKSLHSWQHAGCLSFDLSGSLNDDLHRCEV